MMKKTNKSYDETRVYSPDGRFMFVYEDDKLFRLSDKTEIKTFKETANATCVVFSEDSNFLLTKSDRGKLLFIDTSEGKILKKLTFKELRNQFDPAIISFDNRYIINIVCQKNYRSYLSVWNTQTCEETRYFENENLSIIDIRYVWAKNKYFISGYRAGEHSVAEIKISFCMWFDPNTGEYQLIHEVCDIHTCEFKRGDEDCVRELTYPTRFIYSQTLDEVISYYERIEGVKQLCFLSQNRIVDLESSDNRIMSAELSPDEKMLGVMFRYSAGLYTFPDLKLLDELETETFGEFQFLPSTSDFYITFHMSCTDFYKKNKDGRYGK